MRHSPYLVSITVAVLLFAAAVLLLPDTQYFNVTDWRMLLNSATGHDGPTAESATIRQRLTVPSGWSIGLYTGDVPKARLLRATRNGDLLLSQPRLGRILLLAHDADQDGHPDAQRVLLEGLDRPHGIDIAGDWLYVAEGSAIGRVGFDAATGRLTSEYRHILSDLPSGGNHWSRTVRMGPDNLLYVTIGSSCNACEEKSPWRAAMLRFHPDGTGVEIHASGLRNSVGFDWAPWSGELYATDNGRDLLGDDFPPCELNRIVAGGFYGWPYVNGDGVPDPDFGNRDSAKQAEAIAPVHDFRAHTAPLGITFVRHPDNIARLGHAALVALHGSWNRSTPDGYAVVLLQWLDDGTIRETPFLSGFEAAGNIIGRPVDIAEGADGAFYVSDDYAGAVYRIAPDASGDSRTLTLAPRTEHPDTDPLAGIDAATIAAAQASGPQLWQRFACAECHSAGQPPGTQLENLQQRYDVASLSEYFLLPTAPMPSFPLDADERRALAIWLLANPHPPAAAGAEAADEKAQPTPITDAP